MQVLLARAKGFCFGVNRAMSRIEELAAGSPGSVYLLGKLVHNRQAVERLEDLGARLVDSPQQVPEGAALVISTHGMGPEIRQEAKSRGITLVDATCPFVARIHRVVAEMADTGFAIFVFGDAGHKEVRGILAWARGKAVAIESAADVETRARKIGLVAQTTKNIEAYRRIVQEVAGRYLGSITELRVADTICDATAQRQEAAVELAQQVDVMVVVGGADSANTKRLGELCRATGTPTYVVEDSSQLEAAWFAGAARAGVTAGASTPNWVIDEVVASLERL